MEQCPVCGWAFSSHKALQSHLETHPAEELQARAAERGTGSAVPSAPVVPFVKKNLRPFLLVTGAALGVMAVSALLLDSSPDWTLLFFGTYIGCLALWTAPQVWREWRIESVI